jgi:CheY-like chemotaxis protein
LSRCHSSDDEWLAGRQQEEWLVDSNPELETKTVLFVDDEQYLFAGYADSLSVDYNVIKARTADEALRILRSAEHTINLVLLDVMMPPGKEVTDPKRGRTSGLSFVKRLEQLGIEVPVVCLTVIDDPDVEEQLLKHGVKRIIKKRELPSVVEEAVLLYMQ